MTALFPLLVAGVYLGRPMARMVVLIILPPKQRVFFAFLWDADGKALPKGGVSGGPRSMASADKEKQV